MDNFQISLTVGQRGTCLHLRLLRCSMKDEPSVALMKVSFSSNDSLALTVVVEQQPVDEAQGEVQLKI